MLNDDLCRVVQVPSTQIVFNDKMKVFIIIVMIIIISVSFVGYQYQIKKKNKRNKYLIFTCYTVYTNVKSEWNLTQKKNVFPFFHKTANNRNHFKWNSDSYTIFEVLYLYSNILFIMTELAFLFTHFFAYHFQSLF